MNKPALLVVISTLMLATRASAHPEFSPVTTNRYLKLDLVAADEVRLAYSVMYGAGPAMAERRRADTNGDGKLDDAESRTLGEELRKQVAANLKLTVDGNPATFVFETPAVGLAGVEVGPSPFSVDLLLRISLPGAGPHTLILDDATELPQLGETELRIEESPRTRLLEGHRGKGPGPRESKILFRGPKFSALEDRSVTVRFEAADSAAPAGGERKAKLLGLFGAAALLLGLTLGLVLVRRYRSMKG